MTPVEWVIAAIIFLIVTKNAFVEGAFAVRGKVSPRMQARANRGEAGRYFSGLWNDTWRGFRERREARMAGLTPPPRQQGWLGRTYGRLRGRVTSWWDHATTRVDNRRQAEAIRGEERRPASRWQRLTDRLMGRDASAWPAVQRRPGEDFTGRKRRRHDDPDDPGPPPSHPGPPVYYDVPDTRLPNGNGRGRPSGAPMPFPIYDPRAQGAGGNHQKEQEMSGETPGLSQALSFTEQAARSNAEAARHWEQHVASVTQGGVSGAPVEAARRAAEAQMTASQLADAAHAAYEQHNATLGEGYRANPEAGGKEFNTK